MKPLVLFVLSLVSVSAVAAPAKLAQLPDEGFYSCKGYRAFTGAKETTLDSFKTHLYNTAAGPVVKISDPAEIEPGRRVSANPDTFGGANAKVVKEKDIPKNASPRGFIVAKMRPVNPTSETTTDGSDAHVTYLELTRGYTAYLDNGRQGVGFTMKLGYRKSSETKTSSYHWEREYSCEK